MKKSSLVFGVVVVSFPILLLYQNMVYVTPTSTHSTEPILSMEQLQSGAEVIGKCVRRIAVDGFANASDDTQYALLSLQGLINRQGPCLYLYQQSKVENVGLYVKKLPSVLETQRGDRMATNQFLDFVYGVNGPYNPKNFENLGDASNASNEAQLLKTLIKIAKTDGAFVYDSNRPATILPAISASGVQNLVILSDRLKTAVDAIIEPEFRSLAVQKLNAKNLFPETKASDLWLHMMTWVDNHLATQLSKSQLFLIYPSADRNPQPSIDLAIQRKLPAVWRPFHQTTQDARPDDDEYSVPLENLFKKFMIQSNPNAFIYGWVGVTTTAKPFGWDERPAIDYFSSYGKLIINTAQADNLSFHNRFRLGALPPQPAYQADVPAYDRKKKYIAFTMQDSGTCPWYFENLFHRYQWTNQNRPSMPMTWAMTPQMGDLMPMYVQALYRTATPNNYFLASEGLGYGILFKDKFSPGYAVNLTAPEGSRQSASTIALGNYFSRLDLAMESMGMTAFSMHSHPNGWDAADEAYFSQELASRMTPRMKDLLLDMNINESVAAKDRALLFSADETRVRFRTINRFDENKKTYLLRDTSDAALTKAAEELYGDITNYVRNNPADSQFLLVTALSWSYNSDRMAALKQQLGDDYVFLTEYQMGQVFRASQGGH